MESICIFQWCGAKFKVLPKKNGNPMPVVDALIAAMGIVHNFTVVTRNVADMEQSTVMLLNPWSG
jgi:predicted nucleic acid-binding protein